MTSVRWITVTGLLLVIAPRLSLAAPKEIIEHEQEPMVIVNNHQSHFIDAVGKPLPKPMVPAPLASPVNLLNPDKYEFYTFDDKGELIKRLMTMEEIQSIVANGDSEGTMFLPNTQDKDSEADIQGILENIQDVLSKEIEKNANDSNNHFLDTPDVSSNWNLILPAIFGNTGDPIIPQSKPPSYSMTPESDIIVETTTKQTYKKPKPTKASTTPKPITTPKPVTVPKVVTTPKPVTTAKPTPVVYKTTPGKISSVVYPSKIKKPIAASPPRPYQTPVELKNNFPMEIEEEEEVVSITKAPIQSAPTSFKTTKKPFRPTQSESVKIVSTATKFRPTGTTTFYSTRFTARPSTLIVTEPATTKRIETTTTTTTAAPTTPSTTTTTTTTTPKPTTTTTERMTTTTTTTTTPKPTTTTTERTTTTTTTPRTTTTPMTTTTTTTTTTPRPTTTTTTTTTTTPKPTTTTPEPITTEAPKVEEEMAVEDPLHQIIQTLNEAPSAPSTSATKVPIATEKMAATTESTEDVETATKIYRPLEYLIPVDIHPDDVDVLVKIAQNFGIGDEKMSDDGTTVQPNFQPNLENKPNKVFTNSELYVDEEEPEVHENPTTLPPPKRTTTPYPIYNRPNGIAQKVDEYIASQSGAQAESSIEDSVAVDTMALPFMSQKINGFVANFAQMQKENAAMTTTVQPEVEVMKDGGESEGTTSGYSMLEESLSGILNQVSDSRPHSVPLVEDHRIESKIKDIENPEELTIDEELDKLESDPSDNDGDDEEEEDDEDAPTSTTERIFEKVDVISKNELPPLEDSVATPQEDKFEELESLSLIVDALNDRDENDLKDGQKETEEKEESEKAPTTTEIPTPTTQKVTFVTSIVKETHSVSVHQEKPAIVQDVKNSLEMENDENAEEEVEMAEEKSQEMDLEQAEEPNEDILEPAGTKLDVKDDRIETIKEDEEEDCAEKDNKEVIANDSPVPPTTTEAENVQEEEKQRTTTEVQPIEKTTVEQEEEQEQNLDQEEDIEKEQPLSETTTNPPSSASDEFPEDLQVENLTLDAELLPTTLSPHTTPTLVIHQNEEQEPSEPQTTTTEATIEVITEAEVAAEVLPEKALPEVLRKSDLDDATEMQQDETVPPTTTEVLFTTATSDLKEEEVYERLGETTTVEADIESIYSTLGETTTTMEPEETTTETEQPTTTAPRIIPETTTAAEEIITKAETQYKPTKVRFQPSNGGYRPTGAFKRPAGSVFHIKNKPAIRVEQRNPTRNPLPVRLQSAPKDSLGLEQSTVNVDPDYMDFTRLCNELAFSYWTTLQTDGVSTGRSVILSPFGITSMLSMVFLGARGATSGEMNEILKLDDMITFNPHLVFRNVTDSIENLRENGVYTSALVRELFSDRSKGKLLPFYKEKSQQYYAGYVEEANFNLINDIVRRRTNLLIKRHTWGKIMEYLRTNNLVLKGPLAAVTATVFQTDCSKASVADRDGEMFFQMEPEVKQRKLVPVPSVVIKSGFTAGYDPELDATMVGLGNGNNIVSTLLLMPGQQGTNAPGDNLERLEEAFMAKPVDNWHRLLTTLMERQDLEVQIPKFTHRSFINGTTLMQRMGLKELFDSSKSDLRGLTANANQDMYLADLLQINTFSTCGEDKIPDSHYKEVYPSPPSQKQLNYARLRKLSKKMHNPYLSTLPENILSRMHLTADQVSEANEETVKYVEYQRALFDPFYDTKYMELPLPLRPRQARIPDSPRLKFDKPFLYFVRHNPTGMILYLGRFNPKLN